MRVFAIIMATCLAAPAYAISTDWDAIHGPDAGADGECYSRSGDCAPPGQCQPGFTWVSYPLWPDEGRCSIVPTREPDRPDRPERPDFVFTCDRPSWSGLGAERWQRWIAKYNRFTDEGGCRERPTVTPPDPEPSPVPTPGGLALLAGALGLLWRVRQ